MVPYTPRFVPARDVSHQARDTQDDLRGRRFLTSNMDVYQWLLMNSTHSQRHIMQIREVKAHASYPKR